MPRLLSQIVAQAAIMRSDNSSCKVSVEKSGYPGKKGMQRYTSLYGIKICQAKYENLNVPSYLTSERVE